MSHKRKWRKRTHGTSRQIGKSFIIDDESQQYRKAKLPRASSGVRASREMLDLKEKYEQEERNKHRSRKEILEDEVRQEMEDKKHQPKKSTTEKIRNAVKAIQPKPEPPTRTIMGVAVPDKKEEFTLEDVPDELREEIRPVMAEAKSDGRAISNYLKNSRIERFFEKRAMIRKIKKEKEKESQNQSNHE